MIDEFYKVIGQAIRERREEIGMTQAELAQLVSMSRPSIINIEQGGQALQLHQFVELAEALQYSSYTDLLPEIEVEL